MPTLHATLSNMRRPSLLVQAAQHAAQSGAALRHTHHRPTPILLAEEERLNTARLNGGLGYSPLRHVEVMGALLHAAQAAQQEQQKSGEIDQTKASGILALRVAI